MTTDLEGEAVTANTGATGLALTGAPMAGALTSALALLFFGVTLWVVSCRRHVGRRAHQAVRSGS